MKKFILPALLFCTCAAARPVDDHLPLRDLPEGTLFQFQRPVDLYFCKQYATQIRDGQMSCKNFKVKSHVIFDGPRGLFEGSQTEIASGQVCTLKQISSYGYRFYFKEATCPELHFQMNWEGIKNYITRVEDLKKVLGDMVSIQAPEE